MDRQDYFAPARYEPRRKPPRRVGPAGVVLLVLLGIGLAGLAAYGVGILVQAGAARQTAAEEKLTAVVIPPAKVITGKPLKWRELERYDRAVSREHPRPSYAVGEFDGDGSDELLLIDYEGPTTIFELAGGRREVPQAKWRALALYEPWDYDRNGVCELVPSTLFYFWQPKVKSYVRIRGAG